VTTNPRAANKLTVWDFNFEGKRKIVHNAHRLGFCFVLITELKHEMFDPETKGCKRVGQQKKCLL
jgi:hypothetical protein